MKDKREDRGKGGRVRNRPGRRGRGACRPDGERLRRRDFEGVAGRG